MTNGCCTATATVPAREGRTARSAGATPALDVTEAKDEFVARLDVPGRGPEDVELNLENRVLTIRARVPARDEASRKYHVREHDTQELVRRIRLSDGIHADGIRADVARGVLTVRLPKAEEAKAKRIEVR
jgi:HSP20 family molecular chaperone IbpA